MRTALGARYLARVHMKFLLRQLLHDARVNLLAVPAFVLAAHLAAGIGMPWLERTYGAAPLVAEVTRVVAVDPATAQMLMTTVASAIMTVVSVVYSVLLVALSLASIQFSTRILVHFMQDRVNQAVLGMFVGTFAYCLAVLRSVTTTPAWVPAISVALGVALALACLASLVLFIHRIAMGIQANVLVDRIAVEAESVIDAVFAPTDTEPPDVATDDAHDALPVVVRSLRSGYVQIVDVEALKEVAGAGTLRMARPVGAFIAEGAPLAFAAAAIGAEGRARLEGAVDRGPLRTMQDDAEYGLRQIVDIALKALSPAVNDPSTACTCIDHLGRLLLRIAARRAPQTVFTTGLGGRVIVPNTRFRDCVDVAFDQLRQYGASDMAVQLRMLRVLTELAGVVTDAEDRARVALHGRLLHAASRDRFPAEDREALERRWTELGQAVTTS